MKWSRKYSRCQGCGDVTWPHHARGLCVACYARDQYGIKCEYIPRIGWARNYDRCIRCKRDDVPHKGNGLCKICYQKEYYKNRKDVDEHRK